LAIGVPLIPASLAILTSLSLKETPKFLLLNREDKQAAIESLAFYQGGTGNSAKIIYNL
jgi:hypothetical protein